MDATIVSEFQRGGGKVHYIASSPPPFSPKDANEPFAGRYNYTKSEFTEDQKKFILEKNVDAHVAFKKHTSNRLGYGNVVLMQDNRQDNGKKVAIDSKKDVPLTNERARRWKERTQGSEMEMFKMCDEIVNKGKGTRVPEIFATILNSKLIENDWTRLIKFWTEEFNPGMLNAPDLKTGEFEKEVFDQFTTEISLMYVGMIKPSNRWRSAAPYTTAFWETMNSLAKLYPPRCTIWAARGIGIGIVKRKITRMFVDEVDLETKTPKEKPSFNARYTLKYVAELMSTCEVDVNDSKYTTAQNKLVTAIKYQEGDKSLLNLCEEFAALYLDKVMEQNCKNFNDPLWCIWNEVLKQANGAVQFVTNKETDDERKATDSQFLNDNLKNIEEFEDEEAWRTLLPGQLAFFLIMLKKCQV
tara:strand:+ start:715 stop:1953 length:1239 start_codon:yes stop_codon:yes gene_type:complete